MARFDKIGRTTGIFQSRNALPDIVKKTGRMKVAPGVICDTYDFVNTNAKDLGIVIVAADAKTPRQLVLNGILTLEDHISGNATLRIEKPNGHKMRCRFRDGLAREAIAVEIGEIMQWRAKSDLTFGEVCYPPYRDGRYENLPD